MGARRPDGFHDIDTLFQSVSLADRVEVELDGEEIALAVTPSEVDLGPVRENLAYRAADAFRRASGLEDGVRVSLAKRIPAGAGLGGGSSDAAAVLRCLSALTGAVPPAELAGIAADLGSDVPFFLGDGTLARGTGRGERLHTLEAWPVGHLVLCLPPVHVSTAGAYRALAVARAGSLVGDKDQERLPSGWPELEGAAHNDFQPVVASAHRQIARSLQALEEAGARVALLSGSGSACFGLFSGDAEAREAACRLTESLGWRCETVETLSEPPLVEAGNQRA